VAATGGETRGRIKGVQARRDHIRESRWRKNFGKKKGYMSKPDNFCAEVQEEVWRGHEDFPISVRHLRRLIDSRVPEKGIDIAMQYPQNTIS